MQVIPRAAGTAHPRLRSGKLWKWHVAALFAMFATAGCTRAYYHDYADRDVYGILKERLFDWRWRVPERPVEAPPISRMADLNDPNHEALVTDDVAARRFQVSSRFPLEYHGWKKRGSTPIEDLSWQPYVPLDSDGKILLSKDSIMRIAMVNSRDYQTNFESLYLSALGLTLARFQFMIQGFSNWGAFYSPLTGGGVPFNTPTTDVGAISSGGTPGITAAATRTPKPPDLNNQLLLTAANGFTLNLMSGGQFLVNLANSIVFEFSNKGVQVVTPNLTVSFVQPLLRGAWARVVTQGLSLQERNVLYNLRAFAEFRRQFYVSLVASGGVVSNTGYLSLLNQLQNIRNFQKNVELSRQNLTLLEAEFPRTKSALDVSLVANQYQGFQVSLLQSQAGLQTLLDGFKISLGLPTEVEVRIDDSPLDQFELNDERLDNMRTRIEALLLRLQQGDELPRTVLANAAGQLERMYDELEKIHDQVVAESQRWQKKLDATSKQGFEGPEGAHKKEIFDREGILSTRLKLTIVEINEDIDEGQDNVATFRSKLATNPADLEFGITIPGIGAPLVRDGFLKDATQKLRNLVGKDFRALFSAVSVTQTRVRVFLIQLPPVDLTVNQAIQVALGNRLDLQNALAQVTDAWRNVEVDANQLLGFLNFSYNGNFGESPNHQGLFHFDAGNTIQTLGLQFDAPINRRAERNQYRADQIQYQRARRAYMLIRDQIVQQIRLDMRNLVLFQRTFELNREQILSAATQLESAEEDVRVPVDVNPAATLNLLQALTSVLSARNSLIQTWVSYETTRLDLYRDFDLMDIDANGVWTNETDQTAINIALEHARSAPAFSLTIPARIPDLSPGIASDSTFYIDVEPGRKPTEPPDAGTAPLEDQPDITPIPAGRGAGGPDRPGDARPAAPPAAPSPFAPPRPAP